MQLQHKQMTPGAAYEYVRSIRPMVLLASSQWQAVQEYYHFKVKKACVYSHMTNLLMRIPGSSVAQDLVAFDDGAIVVIMEFDLDGYDPSHESNAVGREIWADLSVIYRVRVVSQTALARISCVWLCCHAHQRITREKLGRESSCSIRADQLGDISVDIHVY